MKSVRLRFDTPTTQWRRLLGHESNTFTWAGIGLFVAALLYLGILSTRWTATRQELLSAKQQLHARGLAQPKQTHTRPAMSDHERRGWHQVAGQLNTPWAALLGALEEFTPEHVALVSIEPDVRQSSVRLQAEAKSLDALLVFAQGLQTAGPFAAVTPLKHETNEQDPNRPIRLTLSVRLRPHPWPSPQRGQP